MRGRLQGSPRAISLEQAFRAVASLEKRGRARPSLPEGLEAGLERTTVWIESSGGNHAACGPREAIRHEGRRVMLRSEKQGAMPFAEPRPIAVRKIRSAAVLLMANSGLKVFRGQPKQELKLCYSVRHSFFRPGLTPGRGKRSQKKDKSGKKLNGIPPAGSGAQEMSRAISTRPSGQVPLPAHDTPLEGSAYSLNLRPPSAPMSQINSI
jgi:hypothetical protein